MARSGRFGRLPAAPPDLTASIVSMMEQYQAARDSNIFDAWKNGGEFEGAPVTDSMLLGYIRERRGQYTRDDPEWDEWDNMLYQYRFTIAEQNALLRYDRAMAAAAGIDAPRQQLAAQAAASSAMGGFYRSWSQKLPRNSYAYRDLMRSAAQYAKAVQTANSRSRGIKRAKAKANAPTDYEVYVRRVTAIQTNMVDPVTYVQAALDQYAMAKGFIGEGETLADLSISEGSQYSMLLEALDNSQEGRRVKRWLGRVLPPGTWGGHLDMETLNKFSRRAEEGIKEQIALARGYPGDRSSDVAAFKGRLRDMRHLRNLDDRLTASDLIMSAQRDLQNDRADSIGPSDMLAAGEDYLKTLQRARSIAIRAQQYDIAGGLLLKIKAQHGDVDYLVDIEPRDRIDIVDGETDLLEMAYERQNLQAQQQDLKSGLAYTEYVPASPEYREALAAGNPLPKWRLTYYADDPGTQSDLFVARIDSAGIVHNMRVRGQNVYLGGETDDEADLMVFEYDGHRVYKMRVGNNLVRLPEDDVENTGLRLRPGKGPGGGFVAVDPSKEIDARLMTLARGGDLASKGIDFDAPLETSEEAVALQAIEKAETDERKQMDWQMRSDLLRQMGLSQDDAGVVTQSVYSAGALTPDQLAEQVRQVDKTLLDNYGIEPPGTVVVDDPVGNIIPGMNKTPAAAKTQFGLQADNPTLAYNSDTLMTMNVDRDTWKQFANLDDAAIIRLVEVTPGYTPAMLPQFLTELSLSRQAQREGVRAAVASIAEEGNSRVAAGFKSGVAMAESNDEALDRWNTYADVHGKTPAERASLRAAGELLVPVSRLLDKGLMDIFRADEAKGSPTSRQDLPMPIGGGRVRGRSTPDVVMANGLRPLGGAVKEPIKQPDVNMPSNLTPTLAIRETVKPQRIKSNALRNTVKGIVPEMATPRAPVTAVPVARSQAAEVYKSQGVEPPFEVEEEPGRVAGHTYYGGGR